MKKNILIDISHPSQVHLFKHFYKEMAGRHHVVVTVKDEPTSLALLKQYDIPYLFLGDKSDSILGKAWRQLKYNQQMLRIIREHKIEIGIGTSVTQCQLSKISRMKSFLIDDDDSAVQPFTRWFVNPFADYIVTPACLAFENYGKNHFTYPGNHELAYLHPNRFKPDPGIFSLMGIKPDEKYFILRFNAFKAHHDIGVTGIPIEVKRELIQTLSSVGRVFISGESELDKEFEPYRFTAPQSLMHSFLAYAHCFIGDSQTMTSEAAVLGIPSIRCNKLVGKISYLTELESRFNLAFGYLPEQSDQMFAKIVELLAMPNLKEEWQNRRAKMLSTFIDVTAFLVWLVEEYPYSIDQLRKNPDFSKFS